ncbi:HU family DNA-binding protein [Brackiella oedipodis]|uniref:HU family DNA-binding protein n=1 Tax=Brackiella oedipodis TaxID=124225 RepID=UPI0006881875|nr:HU family DNA-binding protein [Brackiella oedipodis]
MNKTQLIDIIASKTDLPKSKAGEVLDVVFTAVKDSLVKHEDVTFIGFGTFTVGERAARTGRNPVTGEELKIQEAYVPKFRAGKALKDVVKASKPPKSKAKAKKKSASKSKSK